MALDLILLLLLFGFCFYIFIDIKVVFSRRFNEFINLYIATVKVVPKIKRLISLLVWLIKYMKSIFLNLHKKSWHSHG